MSEIQKLIAEQERIRDEIKAVQTRLREAQKSAAIKLAEDVRGTCAELGVDAGDIAQLLIGRKPAKAKPQAGPIVFQNPSNPKQVWLGRKLPDWMRKKMEEEGFDPSLVPQRKKFAAEHLVKIA
jgi:DNA-binding protein H-NS